MKVLITGAHGQVGKELTKLAKESGFDVIAASRADLDITQTQEVETFITESQAELVINAAAHTAVDKAESEPDLAFAINHKGAENIAFACKKNAIPLLHISTDYVFNGSHAAPYSEKDIVSPLGIYGESKWQGEEAIRHSLNEYIILRVAWVFGAQGNNFVKTMLRLANDRDELNIVADQFGGPSPAKDIAKTLIYLATLYKKNQPLQWGTYHYCGAPKTSWCDFAEEIFKQGLELGLLTKNVKANPITTAEYPTAAKRPSNSMLNCDKINTVFNIDMPDWKAGLKDVLTELK